MLKRLSYILLICILSQHVTAQAADDSTFSKTASNIIDIYYQSLGEQSPLYNGSEYIEYTFTLQEGHPFFGSAAWVDGDIHFDGMIFHEVPILYDIVKDQVIIQDFQKIYKINLPVDKIQQFTLPGHTFIRLMHDSTNQIRTGFYDQLYNGKTGLFAKREKKIIEKNSNLQINNVVINQSNYYIRKGGVYYTIKNKRTLFDVLKNRKKEVQQYFKKNRIKFKNDPEKAMIIAVEYYDRLTN
jgi:hypothetical protein